MMRHLLKFLMIALLLCSPSLMVAQGSATDYSIIVNGSPIEKPMNLESIYSWSESTSSYLSVVKLRLSWVEDNGDYSFLDFHPLQLQILFGESVATDIDKVCLFDGGDVKGKATLEGLPSGTPVLVYDSAGRMCLSTRTGNGQTVLDTSSLTRGIYVMKAGKTVIKFNKK